MPIYEFECRSCGNEFEHMQSFSATTTPTCVACGSDVVTRRLGRPAIHFKGSGWYITDSKKKNPAASVNGNGADKSSVEKSSENGSEKSSESAAEPKVEAKTESSKPAAAPIAAD
jgi:putative FmdB family regulatory protein